MKKYLLLFFVTLPIFVFATEQMPDYLIIGKDTISLISNPLKKYFESNPLRDKETQIVSTNLWRGYVAYFKFEDNKLVVENIYEEQEIINSDKTHFVSIYKEIFGEKINFECNFYSGILVGYSGEITERMKPGFWDIYEKYKLFEITNGRINNNLEFNDKEFIKYKTKYFKQFKKTEAYKLQFDKNYASFMTFEDSHFSKKKNLTTKEIEKLVKKSVEDYIFYFLFH
ncbi:hypothetical protein [Flavobacterium facile]|uniref:hypothetical protein n=1 Tax=Flavobacterium facile TaxID=2893174 RepID=UPI002E794AD8|nr:hypothetical protein [Flavobacterium sp. T-12]